MASARRVVEVPEVSHIALTLTREEAEVLTGILCLVGGPSEGLRGKATSILGALDAVGVPRPWYLSSGTATGGIEFHS